MIRFTSIALLLCVATAASAQSMSSLVAESVLKVCPTATAPEQCVADFAPVIQEAKAVDSREAAFRNRYPDPKFGSVAVMQASQKVHRAWTQVINKHDRTWSH